MPCTRSMRSKPSASAPSPPKIRTRATRKKESNLDAPRSPVTSSLAPKAVSSKATAATIPPKGPASTVTSPKASSTSQRSTRSTRQKATSSKTVKSRSNGERIQTVVTEKCDEDSSESYKPTGLVAKIKSALTSKPPKPKLKKKSTKRNIKLGSGGDVSATDDTKNENSKKIRTLSAQDLNKYHVVPLKTAFDLAVCEVFPKFLDMVRNPEAIKKQEKEFQNLLKLKELPPSVPKEKARGRNWTKRPRSPDQMPSKIVPHSFNFAANGSEGKVPAKKKMVRDLPASDEKDSQSTSFHPITTSSLNRTFVKETPSLDVVAEEEEEAAVSSVQKTTSGTLPNQGLNDEKQEKCTSLKSSTCFLKPNLGSGSTKSSSYDSSEKHTSATVAVNPPKSEKEKTKFNLPSCSVVLQKPIPILGSSVFLKPKLNFGTVQTVPTAVKVPPNEPTPIFFPPSSKQVLQHKELPLTDVDGLDDSFKTAGTNSFLDSTMDENLNDLKSAHETLNEDLKHLENKTVSMCTTTPEKEALQVGVLPSLSKAVSQSGSNKTYVGASKVPSSASTLEKLPTASGIAVDPPRTEKDKTFNPPISNVILKKPAPIIGSSCFLKPNFESVPVTAKAQTGGLSSSFFPHSSKTVLHKPTLPATPEVGGVGLDESFKPTGAGTNNVLESTWDGHLSSYDITVYEELDEDLKHRENKTLPTWASEKEALQAGLFSMVFLPEYQHKIQSCFPKPDKTYKLFPTSSIVLHK